MVDTTQKIVNDFVSYYTENNENVSLDDMKKKLTEIYKSNSNSKKNKKSKNDGDTTEKKKKEASPYNIFMKEQMHVMKDTVPDAKERMKKVAELWSNQKKDGKTEVVEVKPEPKVKPELKVEVELPPEVKSEVKKKKSPK
jgi:hypothetical protein